MPKIIYFLGGTLGQKLRSNYPNGKTIDNWAEPIAVATGSVRTMELAGNGITPGGDKGRQQTVSGLVGHYAVNLEATIQDGLEGPEWHQENWGYDWRLSIMQEGERLADAILALTVDQLPATIVGHSQGGIVARQAWRKLWVQGENARIRRIITIGTPHYGSYGAIGAMLGDDPLVSQIVDGSRTARFFTSFIPFWGSKAYTAEELARIIATWPAYYELLPFSVGPGPADPFLSRIWTASNWPAYAGVSQAWLNHAQQVWQVSMAASSSHPPMEVMTCYVASGNWTPAGLNPWVNNQVKAPNWATTSADGDSRVIVERQSIPTSKVINFAGEHHVLLEHPAVLGTIVAEILEERTPGPPPPPADVPTVYKAVDPTSPFVATIPQDPAVPPKVGNCPGGLCTC